MATPEALQALVNPTVVDLRSAEEIAAKAGAYTRSLLSSTCAMFMR